MSRDTEDQERGLRDYLQVLRRRRRTIALCTVLAVGVAVTLAELQVPIYRATAEILVQPGGTQSVFNPNTGQALDPGRDVQTEIRILQSAPVKALVQAKVGVTPHITAFPVVGTNVFDVAATSTDPRQASTVANTYANAYIDFRRAQNVNDQLAAATQVQNKITELQREIDGLNRPTNGSGATVSPAAGSQAETLIQQQSVLKQRLDQLQVDASLKTGDAKLVTPAPVPSSPASPKPVTDAILALFAGLVVGTGLAFGLDYLDDSIRTREEVERITGVPVLGLVPSVPGWKAADGPRVVSIADPQSPAAEAYRALRTSLEVLRVDRPVRVVQITSPVAQEGKSTTLANLGVTLARAGERVVLVCCDLRRPRIHEFFGLGNEVGFTSVVSGQVPLNTALQAVPGEQGLWLLASGPLPSDPAELLASQRVLETLTAIKAIADVVLIDCPPALPVTDAAVLAARVDSTLIVVSSERTSRRDLGRVADLLKQVRAPVVGAVLNGVTPAGAYGYGYGYGYRYDAHGAEGPAAPGGPAPFVPVVPAPTGPFLDPTSGAGRGSFVARARAATTLAGDRGRLGARRTLRS